MRPLVLHRLPLCCVMSCWIAAPSAADDEPDPYRPPSSIGIGASVGAPTGATVQAIVARRVAIELAGGRDAFESNDWLLHATLSITVLQPNLQLLVVPIYVGAGGSYVDRAGGSRKGLRVVFGIRGQTAVQSFQMFLEGALRFDISPDTEASPEATLGFRYFL